MCRTSMSLVAIGALYVDTILTPPHYPSEDEKLRATSLSRRRGGNCPNSLEVLQQLTSSTSGQGVLNLVTVLPAQSSVAAQQIRAELEPRVSLEQCIYREEFSEPASSYIIKSLESGSRTIVNYNELPEMSVDEVKGVIDSVGEKAGWFHFEGRIPEIILEGIKHIRSRFPSARVSVEVEKPQRPGLQELAVEADAVFYSKSWAVGNDYSSAEECLREQAKLTKNASLLCCTWGQDGAFALEPKTSTFLHSPAYSAPGFHVVDTIGAGDTFIAGMLYGLIWRNAEWDVDRKLGFANRVAGIKVGQEGFGGLSKALESF